MGFYKYIRNIWKKPRESLGVGLRDKLVKWRREPITIRIERPTRIDRARALGYKAKQGIFMVRQKLLKGGHTRPTRSGGRRSKRMTIRKVLSKNYQLIAEERANKAFPNCEVLNSYSLVSDGKYHWFEVIMVDKALISKDKSLGWLAQPHHRGRVYRGLTSAGRKMRGLRRKGKGAEKVRPSRNAR